MLIFWLIEADVASEIFQERVADDPEVIEVGLAVKELMVGRAGGGVTVTVVVLVTVPPAPVANKV